MAETTPTTKPGFKTPGFWVTLVVTVMTALGASGVHMGPNAEHGFAFVLAALGTAGYATWRAFVKSADPKKPAWKTSEFWLGAAQVAVTALFASGGFAEGTTGEKVVAFAAMVLGALGYAVVKPKGK